MCRLYASLGPRGPPAEELVRFAQLCRGGCGGPHDSGWGIAGFEAPGAARLLVRSTLPATEDPALAPACAAAARFPAVLAHLRKASVGSPALEHTHPFVRGGWAFAHNGTVRGGYHTKLGAEGANDSATLFARLAPRLLAGEDPAAALRAMVREVHDGGFPYSSITTLLTDGARVWALRQVRERPEEYTLRWQRQPDGRVVLCQEPILPGPWEALGNGHIAVAGPGGVEVQPL